MNKKWLAFLILLLLAPVMQAQTLQNPLQGPLQASSATCAPGAGTCVWMKLAPNIGTVAVTVTGTFSETIAVEQSNDGVTFANVGTLTTATTAQQFSVAGMTDFRLRVSAYVSGNALATLQASTAGGSSTAGVGSALGINAGATKYGLISGLTIPDATLTVGTNNVSAPNNDGNFTAAMNGWSCFATNMTSDASSITSLVQLPQTLQTVGTWATTGAQTGTCSGAGGSLASIVGAATLVVAPKMAVGLNSAWTDTVAICGHLQIPPGVYMIESGIFVTSSNACDMMNANTQLSISGLGVDSVIFVPSPDMNPATCTGGGTGICVAGGAGINWKDFTIFGAGNSGIGAGFNGKYGLGLSVAGSSFPAGTNSTGAFVNGLGWGAGTAGFGGLLVQGQSGAYISNVDIDGMGSTNCTVQTAQFAAFNQTICGSMSKNALLLNVGPNNFFYDYGGIYGQAVGGGVSFAAVDVSAGGKAWFIGSSIPYTTGTAVGACALYARTAATVYIIGGDFVNPSIAASAGALCVDNSAAKIYARDALIGPAGTAIETFGTGTFVLQGGNTINGTVAINNAGTLLDEGFETLTGSITNTGTIAGPNVLQGSCSGVVTPASTLGPYGLGQFAALTCTSTVTTLGQVMPQSGTLLGVTVTSGTAGIAGSGVVTVLKNGGATTITCTLATTSRCTDFGHATAYVQGDVISAQFTTQAADTLANVKVGIYRQ